MSAIISAILNPVDMPSSTGAPIIDSASGASWVSTEPASVHPGITTSAPSSSTHNRAASTTASMTSPGVVRSGYKSFASMPNGRWETKRSRRP